MDASWQRQQRRKEIKDRNKLQRQTMLADKQATHWTLQQTPTAVNPQQTAAAPQHTVAMSSATDQDVNSTFSRVIYGEDAASSAAPIATLPVSHRFFHTATDYSHRAGRYQRLEQEARGRRDFHLITHINLAP
jgi:hypothetical protein